MSKEFFGIKLKKGVSKRHLFALFYVFFLSTSIGGYINVQTIYLLRDPDYFNMETAVQGRVCSNVLFVAILAGICMMPIAGYSYDMFGRKLIIFAAISIASLLLIFTPYSSPSILALTLLRVFIACCLATIACHPLIMDMIKKESRGKAAAI